MSKSSKNMRQKPKPRQGNGSGTPVGRKPIKKQSKRKSPVGTHIGGINHAVPLKGNAFHSLWERRRHKNRVDEKSKGSRLRDEVPTQVSDADSIGQMSDGVSPWSTYNISLKGFSTLTASGAGVLALAIPADPSGSGYNFAEYSDLSAIFSEVRILSLSIQLVTIQDNAVAVTASTPMLVGFNSILSSAPATEGAVASLAESTYWQAGSDKSTKGSIFHVKYDPRLDFSITSAVTTTPYAGCPGSFQLYASGFPNGSVVGKVLVLGMYQFRGRS
jgi:hypothetical protein